MVESSDQFAAVQIHHGFPTVERYSSASDAHSAAERLRAVHEESGPPVEVVVVDTIAKIVQLITHGTSTTSDMDAEIESLCSDSWSVGHVG